MLNLRKLEIVLSTVLSKFSQRTMLAHRRAKGNANDSALDPRAWHTGGAPYRVLEC